jgi:hypothetical protein
MRTGQEKREKRLNTTHTTTTGSISLNQSVMKNGKNAAMTHPILTIFPLLFVLPLCLPIFLICIISVLMVSLIQRLQLTALRLKLRYLSMKLGLSGKWRAGRQAKQTKPIKNHIEVGG